MLDPSLTGEGAPALDAPDAVAPEIDGDKPMAAPAWLSEPLPAEPVGEAHNPADSDTIIARYGIMHQIGLFTHNLSAPPRPGARVVIRTDRGVELGEVVLAVQEGPCHRCIRQGSLDDYLRQAGPDYPFHKGGRVLRLANPQDVIDHRHLNSSSREEGAFCRQQIRELNLPMKLVTVEHLLGGERIIFHFLSESRIDFRELVRRLAAQFRTRIEMRQVGARDEARLVADFERCGQRCCCQQFLKDLKPVSMRMAKTQKATLDPSKISGRCGRLMCCLRYEDEVYECLRKRLPRKNTWVRTADGVARVIDGQIITQIVRLALPDNTIVAVPVEDILERDLPAPPPPAAVERRERLEPRERPSRLLRDEAAGQESPAPAMAAAGVGSDGENPATQAMLGAPDIAGEAYLAAPTIADDVEPGIPAVGESAGGPRGGGPPSDGPVDRSGSSRRRRRARKPPAQGGPMAVQSAAGEGGGPSAIAPAGAGQARTKRRRRGRRGGASHSQAGSAPPPSPVG